MQVSSAEAYEGVLAREGITLAVADRTEAIWRDVCEAAAKVGYVNLINALCSTQVWDVLFLSKCVTNEHYDST